MKNWPASCIEGSPCTAGTTAGPEGTRDEQPGEAGGGQGQPDRVDRTRPDGLRAPARHDAALPRRLAAGPRRDRERPAAALLAEPRAGHAGARVDAAAAAGVARRQGGAPTEMPPDTSGAKPAPVRAAAKAASKVTLPSRSSAPAPARPPMLQRADCATPAGAANVA